MKKGKYTMKKLLVVFAAGIMFSSLSHAAETQKNEDEKTLYAVGVNMARSISVFNLTPKDRRDVVQRGLEFRRRFLQH